MDRSKLGAFLVWPVLLALALGEAVLFARLGDLEAAVLEARAPERTPRVQRPTDPDRPLVDLPPASLPAPVEAPASTDRKPPAQVRAVDPAASIPVAQIEDAVRRILEEREKASPFKVGVQVLEDPVVLLERELKLSAAQKDQLLRFRKERSTAHKDLGRSELRKSHPDVWKEQGKSVEDLYQARVRNLLDAAQQEKYDRLREAGRLWDPSSEGFEGVMYTVDQKTPAERTR